MFKRKFQPIIRRKLSFFVVPSLIVSFIFVLYQIRMFYLLSRGATSSREPPSLPRGVHEQNARFYQLNSQREFTCIHSKETVDFKKVNDDYCDCLDGSDEPGTNACPNGVFHCHNFRAPYARAVPSNRVNDGICDCCDGSDEWSQNNVLGSFSNDQEQKSNRYHVPCTNRC